MRVLNNDFSFTKSFLPFLIVLIMAFGVTSDALTQERTEYFVGEDNTLEMIVHIIGAVRVPGKYRVRDDTNIIELLTQAGGPNDFSNLNKVTITHDDSRLLTDGQNGTNHTQIEKLTRYDVKAWLEAKNKSVPPKLRPGDVVFVPTNSWRTWKNISTVLRDLAVVASAYFLYLRATQ
jgi:hypothetical protein